MNALSIFCLLLGTSSLMLAQALPKDPEGVLLERWSEFNADRIAGDANGQPITLSDIRRQTRPFEAEIWEISGKDEKKFRMRLDDMGSEALENTISRKLVITEFKTSNGKISASYIDSDIEDTIRRDFGGDRNRFVASLRAIGKTPMSYRKEIEDRIIFEVMLNQIRRTALAVGPGKVKSYYDKNQADFARKESVQLRQITLMQGASETVAEGKARAEAWAAALRDPAKLPATMARFKVSQPKKTPELGFAEIAEIISIDDYAKQGGDTGWKPLEESTERVVGVLRQLKDGEVSEALQFDIPGSPALWFILKREGLKAAGTDTLDDPKVRSLVEDRVRSQAMKEAVDKWFADLRAKHHIEYR